MRVAKRMRDLGTETAFAVSAEACAIRESGRKIYPFHLGDMNIRTPKNIIEAASKAMEDGKTGYCPTSGIPELREEIARKLGAQRGLKLSKENVSIQPGGKPVISKFIMAFMDPGDEVLYPNPGYPIYESQIKFHGGVPKPYGFIATDMGFDLDLDQIERSVTKKTKILIFNNYHNPMGAEAGDEELKRLAEICAKNDLLVLSDEAYFDIKYSGERRSIASLPGMPERTVILYTFSKSFAMTGWRLGAAIGPEWMIKEITRLNVNDESCSNHFIQWGALEGLRNPNGETEKIVGILRERRDVAIDMLNGIRGIKTFRPECTFYLFPDVTDAMKNLGINNLEDFRRFALDTTGVSFCTREHFGTPMKGETRKYIRVAYSGIDVKEIREGLAKLKEAIEDPEIVKGWKSGGYSNHL